MRIAVKNTEVTAESRLPLRHGLYTWIRIQDNGRGISQENLPKVFDPYFTTREKGSGLGLPICHSIVTMHGGYINIESRADEGTTVNIYLPIAGQRAGQGEQ